MRIRSLRFVASGPVLLLAACVATPERGPPPAIDAAPPAQSAAASAASLLGARIAADAERQIGARYRYGGEDPAGGFDCSGLVWYVHRAAGVPVPRTAAAQRAAAAPVRQEELQPGDLVFFVAPRDHVGIYLGGGEFVHAPASGRRVERARLDAPYWLLGYAGAGRFVPPATAASASASADADAR